MSLYNAKESKLPIVHEILFKAIENLKKPVLHYKGYKFSLGPLDGSNPNALYVTRKEGNRYLGKLIPSGVHFHSVGQFCREDWRELCGAVEEFDGENTESLLRDEGHRTGICSCCGRILTNPESIALGIGPICRSKWGL